MAWLVLFLVLTVAVLTVLLVPVRVQLDVSSSEAGIPPVRARVRWLFVRWDSVRARARQRAKQARRDAASAPGPAEPAKKRRPSGGKSRRVRALLTTRGFPSRARRFVVALFRVARPRRVWVRARLGLDDPASTGEVFGLVNGLAAALAPVGRDRPDWDVRLEPVFVEPTLDVRASLNWSVSAGAVLWPALTFAASPVTWRALLAARRA